MKKIIVFLVVLLSINTFCAKSQSVSNNNVEFTCQIVEGKNGSIRIVSNYDYLGEAFWKVNIEAKVFHTKQEAKEFLSLFGFKSKFAVTNKEGGETITMSLRAPASCSVNGFNMTLKWGEMVEKAASSFEINEK